MNATLFVENAGARMSEGEDLLAMHDNTGAGDRCFAVAGIAQTERARLAYR